MQKNVEKRRTESRKKWISFTLSTIFSLTLFFHISSLYYTYTLYRTSTQLSVTKSESAEFTVSACPKFPYSLPGMVEEGLSINISSDVVLYNGYLRRINLDDLVESWWVNYSTIDDDRLVRSIWKNADIKKQMFFKDGYNTDEWIAELTTKHTCFNKKMNSNNIDLNEYVRIERPYNHFNCTVVSPDLACTFHFIPYKNIGEVLLRISSNHRHFPIKLNSEEMLSWNYKPEKYCSYNFPCVHTLSLNAIHRYLVSTPNRPCSDDPTYSQTDCVDNCNLIAAAKRFRCIPPYLSVNDSQLSRYSPCTVKDYRRIGTFELLASDIDEECSSSCKMSCHKIFLSSHVKNAVSGHQVSSHDSSHIALDYYENIVIF